MRNTELSAAEIAALAAQSRPLVRSLPPDEEWVTVGYRIGGPEGPRDLEIRLDWLVFNPKSPAPTIDASAKPIPINRPIAAEIAP